METPESVDKFQVDLDEANAAKDTVEARAKTTEDQVVALSSTLHIRKL